MSLTHVVLNMYSSGHSFRLDIFFWGKFYLDTCLVQFLTLMLCFKIRRPLLSNNNNNNNDNKRLKGLIYCSHFLQRANVVLFWVNAYQNGPKMELIEGQPMLSPIHDVLNMSLFKQSLCHDTCFSPNS